MHKGSCILELGFHKVPWRLSKCQTVPTYSTRALFLLVYFVQEPY